MSGWRFWVDEGGTFTDLVKVSPDGVLTVEKIPSHRCDVDAVVAGWPEPVESVRRGTTRGTNALLERCGAKTLLVTAAGFGDLPWIQDQRRPELFGLAQVTVPPLCAGVCEVKGRVDASGREVEALATDATLNAQLDEVWRRAGPFDSAAVVFPHSHLRPEHEAHIASLLAARGVFVVMGHRASPSQGFLARMETALVDAAISPVLPTDARGVFIKSDGGLVPSERLRGVDAVLSGPAGGVIALAEIARTSGSAAVLGLDMGGTSTDVSRWGGALERRREHRVGGVLLRTPSLAIETVAAGGGSVLTLRAGIYAVGPQSAGSMPGPAAYGRGGPATVTDANVVLGRLRPDCFPLVCGDSGVEPLDVEAARRAVAALDPDRPVEAVAEDFVAVANAEMCRAIQRIATARGHDPADHTLVPFGGAAPLHACGLARQLGIVRVLLHPEAPVLSAWGLGAAEQRDTQWVALHVPVEEWAAVEVAWENLESQFEGALRFERSLDLRYLGTQEPLTVTAVDAKSARAALSAAHLARYGFDRVGEAVEVVDVRLEAVHSERCAMPSHPRGETARPQSMGLARVWSQGWQPAPMWRGSDLPPGFGLDGPALVVGEHTTIWVELGWRAVQRADGLLCVEAREEKTPNSARTARHTPAQIAVAASRFELIAEQMGEALRRLARSVNVRERCDFSCAIFRPDGALVAHAPHVPVHLGAMGETVRVALPRLEAQPEIATWVSNDPYAGGSHLPDITVLHRLKGSGWVVACRAHHADVGGLQPGSMPPHSRTLAEEGVCLSLQPLVDAEGRFLRENLARQLAESRSLSEVLGDLEAQVAANLVGARALSEWFEGVSEEQVAAWAEILLETARNSVRENVLKGLVSATAEDKLEDGTLLRLSLHVENDRLVVDFAGTEPAPGSNLHAPRAVVVASVLYALRCVVGGGLPLNEGVLDCVELRIPDGCVLAPIAPAAVCGGNVETSQRLADLMLRALGAQACGQGTMNNLTLGGADWSYYETIGGGSGAGPGFAGLSGRQVHMTNTRITDVEVLESRVPVRLCGFTLRSGSGGSGRWPGGAGLVRSFEALAPMQVAILAGRRRAGAPGLSGGTDGRVGAEERWQAGGWVPAARVFTAEVGDRFRVCTPGGGGWGEVED